MCPPPQRYWRAFHFLSFFFFLLPDGIFCEFSIELPSLSPHYGEQLKQKTLFEERNLGPTKRKETKQNNHICKRGWKRKSLTQSTETNRVEISETLHMSKWFDAFTVYANHNLIALCRWYTQLRRSLYSDRRDFYARKRTIATLCYLLLFIQLCQQFARRFSRTVYF